ncbi:hypothetical protein YC2023_007852 [Brassica napus]
MTSLWLLTEILPSSRPKPTIETEDDSVGPHGVSSHLSRLLRQIKDRNRRPTTPLWLLTEIHVRVDDSVRVDGVPSVGLSPLANDLFNLEINESCEETKIRMRSQMRNHVWPGEDAKIRMI